MYFSEKFFRATDEMNSYEKHINAPAIRKSIDLTGVKSAEVSIGCPGFYDLFLNGEKITKGLIAPYVSNPDDVVYFDNYFITDKINQGENIFGIQLGNGMQNCPGGAVWDFDKAKFRNIPSFSFALSLEYENGEKKVIEADESFRCHASGIIFDDLRSGCFFDANQEPDGWKNAGFDDSEWEYIRKAETPRGERRGCKADPIVITREVEPQEIYEGFLSDKLENRENMRLDTQYKFGFRGKKGIVFDFGENTAGIFRLKINGAKGQKIFIQFCEHKKSTGEISYENTGSFYPDGYGQTTYYICKGEGTEIFEPSFTYIGYRYAVVFGLTPEQIKKETLTMLAANSDLKERAFFECSDSVMNTLGEMCRRSDLANFYYFPTDCPHREKNGWTGDAAVSAERFILTLTSDESIKEWLHNICLAQLPDGRLPGIVPTGGWGFQWGNGPAWDNVLTEMCYQLYRLRGDLQAASECSDAMLRYLAYVSKKIRPDGLVKFGLGDWLQPGKDPGSPVSPNEITDSVISMYIARKSYLLFDALGLDLYRDFAFGLYTKLRNALRRNEIDYCTMSARNRCQTSQAIFIYYGVFDDCEKQAASRELVKMIEEKGGHFDTGMIGLRTIFHVLSDCGEGELAYNMITREDYPSYGEQIKQGLTAMSECFLPPEQWDRPSSLNHHFMGDIESWFIQRVAGIRVNPRFTSPDDIDITPDFISKLSFAKAHYASRKGRVEAYWHRENENVILEVSCPDGINGYIELPKGYVFDNSAVDTTVALHGAKRIVLKTGRYTITDIRNIRQ